jgi:hypothetical protein
MKTDRMRWFSALILSFALAANLAAQTPPAQPAPQQSSAAQPSAAKVDSETISGLGARNIGSAAMSGRIAALDAVQEGRG